MICTGELGRVIWPTTNLSCLVHTIIIRTWNKKTGPNAPLFDMVGGTPGLSVHGCVENWKAGGGNPNQM